MTKVEVKEGDRYGKLTIIKEVEKKILSKGKTDRQFLCQCECGNQIIARFKSLRNGKRVTCGCYKPKGQPPTHNKSKTRLYHIWKNMIYRCTNPERSHYEYYGGRGIKVCQDWVNDFETFETWALNNGYEESLTIDRIDVNGDYTPDNCRWATRKEQANNTRNNRIITFNGVSKSITQWSEETGISKNLIWERLRRNTPIDKLFARKYNTNLEQSKPILQYDLNGKLVKEWDSIREAERNGFNRGAIYLCIVGKNKTHKGYIWKFKDR